MKGWTRALVAKLNTNPKVREIGSAGRALRMMANNRRVQHRPWKQNRDGRENLKPSYGVCWLWQKCVGAILYFFINKEQICKKDQRFKLSKNTDLYCERRMFSKDIPTSTSFMSYTVLRGYRTYKCFRVLKKRQSSDSLSIRLFCYTEN